MKRKHITALIALIMVFALALTGCGKDQAPAEPEVTDQVWGLSDWDMTGTAWSSNNGATVTLTATPNSHYNEVEASFVIRMEGEEVKSVPCEWDGTNYTATVDLNAADGYCYYLVMRSEGGAEAEFEVNTPGNPSNGKLINMEHSLESYCHMTVNTSKLENNQLTITDGTAEIRLPLITRSGEDVSYSSASVILYFGDEEVAREALAMPESGAEGIYMPEVKNISFEVPQLEDNQQLSIQLEVILNDGQVLTAPGGTWFYTDGQLLLAVG